LGKSQWNGGTGDRWGLYLNKDPFWLDPERTGMGSRLPSSERLRHSDGCRGIHAQIKGKRGAKSFTATRRRRREAEMLRDFQTLEEQNS
jgi:hypothetical protein